MGSLEIRQLLYKLCMLAEGGKGVGTKWRFQFFAKYDYRFLLDVIIATFFAKAISLFHDYRWVFSLSDYRDYHDDRNHR